MVPGDDDARAGLLEDREDQVYPLEPLFLEDEY
jgi:hypothetical protein